MIKLKNPATNVIIEKIDDGFLISISNEEEPSQKFFRKTLNGVINLFYEFWPEKEIIINEQIIPIKEEKKIKKAQSKPDSSV